MINVLTVHWRSVKWVDVQLRYLERNMHGPYRVFAALNGIDEPEVWERFHFAADLAGTHAEKLNELAQIASMESQPGDILMFLDGDAFPIRPIGPWMEDLLTRSPLIAIRRDENVGDPQPHPCFCVTTCEFWASIAGDWREGGTWTTAAGDEVSDVGGTLMHQLADAQVQWTPLLRSNRRNPDPLWFGIYAHRIYHHGAGFRERDSRLTQLAAVQAQTSTAGVEPTSSVRAWGSVALRHPGRILRHWSRDRGKIKRALTSQWVERRRQVRVWRWERTVRRTDAFERRIYDQLRTDMEFYRQLDPDNGSGSLDR